MRKIMLAVLFLAGVASAQLPHQVVVLVNENSQHSKKAANVFVGAHAVPGGNVIYLDVPSSLVSGRAECTPAEFKKFIYEPAIKTLQQRGLSEQVLGWVYSVDFPIRIVTSPNDRQQMSLMGLTYFRGEVPDGGQIEHGRIGSPFFAGPVKPGGAKNPSRSVEVFRSALAGKMPLPSMMLGYVGENGNEMDTVIRCIRDGVRARQSGAHPKVLFVKTNDEKRSAPREWQVDDVKLELAARGGALVTTTNLAPRQSGLMGLMVGAETVTPSDFGTFAPGAMAEHFTSWSAEFQKTQSKCTAWLAAGATVTAGMVTEPYNAWVKFPHVRFYSHYAAGCTAMESFYQSILSPFQVLLLGDPLSQIAGLPVQMKPIGLTQQIASDLDAAFVVEARFPVQVPVLYSALLDGKQIHFAKSNSLIELPFDELGDGYHEVRAIAQVAGPVRVGGFIDLPVIINKKGRSLKITEINDRAPRQIVFSAEATGDELPQQLYLLWNDRELVRAPYGQELVFDERILGEGPHEIQAVAVYADGMEVRSPPTQGLGISFHAGSEGP